MNNEDNYGFKFSDGSEPPPKVLDTYRRHNPKVENKGKMCWFSDSRYPHRGIRIGKVVSVYPAAYVVEYFNMETNTINKVIVDSQACIFPE